jgi:hypothetical protein
MSVQRAYLDYIRLASWDDQAALFLSAELRRSVPKWRCGYWLQYKGYYGDNSFYGIGEQNKKRHYVWRTSGNSSSVLFGLADKFDNLYCTRLDVQVTVKLPPQYNPFVIYEMHKSNGSGRPGISIIDSPTGSTIYFGSRVSDKFARLYEKRHEGGDYLRLEFEFKGKLARAVYETMRATDAGPTAVFKNYLPKFGLADYIMSWFDTGPDAEPLLLEIEHKEDIHKKMSWLASLTNTVVQMGNDHETGDFVRRLLDDWRERIDRTEVLT